MVHLRPAFVSLAAVLIARVSGSVITEKRAAAAPAPWESLAGRSQDDIEDFIKRQGPAIVGAQPLPPPISDTSMKLVHDADHQYVPPGPGDARGPCPGMNSMANHGFYSHTGVDTPEALIRGSQEAYNMGWDLASFVTLYSLVLFGNPLTNLLSIGPNSPLTGPLFPEFPNAVMGGLATHGDFEGDTSQSRYDKGMSGDYLNFNEDIWNKFLEACDEFDGDYYPEVASRMRYLRYEHSKATNPNFSFTVPRYMTAYGETTFPWALMQDGRDKAAGKAHKCRWMRIFYEHSRMPDDFWRREGKFGLFDVGDTVAVMRQTYKLTAGHNEGLGNFIPASEEDQHRLDTNGPCAIYRYACHKVTTFLYPNATGQLRDALITNFANMYIPLSSRGIPEDCPQLFPYEQPC